MIDAWKIDKSRSHGEPRDAAVNFDSLRIEFYNGI